jgi:propanediol utilization protein
MPEPDLTARSLQGDTTLSDDVTAVSDVVFEKIESGDRSELVFLHELARASERLETPVDVDTDNAQPSAGRLLRRVLASMNVIGLT